MRYIMFDLYNPNQQQAHLSGWLLSAVQARSCKMRSVSDYFSVSCVPKFDAI